MDELLSIKRKTKVDELIASVPRPATGIPINALPGWEDVPLYSKLPMLKCPQNQIIFTRSKIGNTLWLSSGGFRLYDPNCYVLKVNYDPLHDPHLKKFFKNKKMQKHLRSIGSITEQNDVVCTLQEFNDYRQLLQRYHLDLILVELNNQDTNQQDLLRLKNANKIMQHVREKCFSARKVDIQKLRQKEQLALQAKAQKIYENFKKLAKRYEEMQYYTREVLKQKGLMKNVRIERAQETERLLVQSRIIRFKRNFMLRHSKFKFNRKMARYKVLRERLLRDSISFEKQLESRRAKQALLEYLIKKADEDRKKKAEARLKKNEAYWESIQKSIEIRSSKAQGKVKGKQKGILKSLIMANTDMTKSISTRDVDLGQLTTTDMLHALETGIWIEENEVKRLENTPNGIIRAAKYILKVVIANFSTDLSKDENNMKELYSRLDKFFTMVKDDQLAKVHAVFGHEEKMNSFRMTTFIDPTVNKSVAFADSTSIGKSTISLDKDVILKHARSRTPTPRGSLTSVAPVVNTPSNFFDKDSHNPIFSKVFVEHFFIKFKRNLVIGVGRRVFEAIRCHKNNKILGTNTQLLGVDRNYLIKVMAKSILAYAVNKYNYHSNLRLCISALSADIIWELQKTLLRPSNDPRYITVPRCRCKMC